MNQNRSHNVCSFCGYDLEGIEAERCPECGRGFVRINAEYSYHESRLGLKRLFLLSKVRIVIRAQKKFGIDSEVPIELHSLDADPVFTRARSANFQYAVASIFGGGLFCGITWFSPVETPAMIRYAFLTSFIIGVLSALATYRKIEHACFQKEGKTVLDVGRCGPDSLQFDEFIATLRTKIRTAKIAKEYERDKVDDKGKPESRA